MADIANFIARQFGQGPDLAQIDLARTRNGLAAQELQQRTAMAPLQQQAVQQNIDLNQANEQRIQQQSAAADQQQRIQWAAGASRYAIDHPDAWPMIVAAGKQRGIFPADFNEPNDPQKHRDFLNQLEVAGLGAKPDEQVLPEGATLVRNGQAIATGAPKDSVDWKDTGDALNPVSHATGKPVPGLAPMPKNAKPGQGGTPMDPDTLDTAAAVVAANPARIRDYASYGSTGQAIRSQINNQIAQRLKSAGMTPNDLIQLRARAAAQPANLVKLTQQNSQIQQAEQLARANGQRLLDLIDLVDQTGVPLVEGITRSARARAGGVDAAEFKSVLNSFQIETARLLSGNPTLAGVISDSARNDIQNIAPDSMSAPQAKRIVNRLFTEMDIRQAAAQDQLQGATNSTTVLPQSGAQQPAAPAGPTRIQSDADYANLQSGAQYIAPDGSTRTKR